MSARLVLRQAAPVVRSAATQVSRRFIHRPSGHAADCCASVLARKWHEEGRGLLVQR